MGDLLDPYEIGASWDEMYTCGGAPRPSYLPLYQVSGPSPRRTWTSAALHGTAASGTRASRSSLSGRGGAHETEPSGPAAAARTAVDWVHDRLRYEIGATDVTTPADSALSRGKGGCQDFAHLALGLLRSLGIPGRYVSGYLHPKEDGEIGETVEGQGHAWIEWWCGAWTAWDPTHGQPVGHRHVLVGQRAGLRRRTATQGHLPRRSVHRTRGYGRDHTQSLTPSRRVTTPMRIALPGVR